MILLFYSEKCELCRAIINLLNEFNIKDKFKLIDILKINKIPENINVVPTIIESELKALIEGKDVYHFILNQKFFFHPTNNIDLWINTPIPKPTIIEDKHAYGNKSLQYSGLDNNNNNIILKQEYSSLDVVFNGINSYNNLNNTENTNNTENINTEIRKAPIIKDKKQLALLKLKKKY
jgi:thiol-disulfide isomerase/thioredoxin